MKKRERKMTNRQANHVDSEEKKKKKNILMKIK
jgi:hypothetical protein